MSFEDTPFTESEFRNEEMDFLKIKHRPPDAWHPLFRVIGRLFATCNDLMVRLASAQEEMRIKDRRHVNDMRDLEELADLRETVVDQRSLIDALGHGLGQLAFEKKRRESRTAKAA